MQMNFVKSCLVRGCGKGHSHWFGFSGDVEERKSGISSDWFTPDDMPLMFGAFTWDVDDAAVLGGILEIVMLEMEVLSNLKKKII